MSDIIDVYIIDPELREITRSTLDRSKPEPLYKQMASQLHCDLIDCAGVIEGDSVWVDDEGIGKANAYLQLEGVSSQPLAGRVMVTGTDFSDGSTVSAEVSSTEILKRLFWVESLGDLLVVSFATADQDKTGREVAV